MKHSLSAIVAVVILLASATAAAQNTMFMRKSPIAHMDEQDRSILRESIDKALLLPDGTVLDWENPATGSGGRLKVLDTLEYQGMTCRNIRARNQARGRQRDGIYKLCKDATGVWRFAKAGNPSSAQQVNKESTPAEAE